MVKNDYCYFDWQYSGSGNLGYTNNKPNPILTKNYNIFIGSRWDGLYINNTHWCWKPLGFERNVLYA